MAFALECARLLDMQVETERIPEPPRARILIVEDEYIIATDLKGRLTSLGYEVLGVVNTGERAVEEAGGLAPDLVLMDIMLKGAIDGVEAARAIGERFGIPVVFVSAYADESILARARMAASMGYLIKPFEDRELRFTIEMAICRARSDRDLRGTREQLRALLETANAIPWEFDLKRGAYTYVGPQIERILGCSPGEWKGWKSWAALIHPDDVREALSRSRRALESGGYYESEYRLVRPGGQEIWVRDVATVIVEDGSPVYVRGFMLDVTAWKHALESLRDSEEKFRVIFDTAGDGIAIVDLDTLEVLLGNSSFAAMLGRTATDVTGLNLSGLYAEDAHERITARFLNQTRGKPALIRDVPLRRGDGRTISVDVSTTTLDMAGRTCMIGFFRDVTGRREAEAARALDREKAEEAVRAKGRFLANVSHEIRGPLYGIINSSEGLIEREQDQEKREALSAIQASARRLLDMTEELLDIENIEAGKFDLLGGEFNPRDVLLDIRRLMAGRARDKGIDLRFEVDDAVAEVVFGDASRLRQVLVSLIDNAIAHTESGGVTVRVRACPSSGVESCISFVVRDTGVGIAPERIGMLFDATGASAPEGARKSGGMGFGLSVAARIASAMGGELSARSVPGEGSTFSFEVMFVRSGFAGAQRLRIALSEENYIDQRVAIRILQKAGHLVTLLGGADAPAAAGAEPFDIVLVGDDPLGVWHGEAVRALKARAEERGTRLAVVLMADDRDLGAGGDSRAERFDGVIAKPLRASELLRIVRAAATG